MVIVASNHVVLDFSTLESDGGIYMYYNLYRCSTICFYDQTRGYFAVVFILVVPFMSCFHLSGFRKCSKEISSVSLFCFHLSILFSVFWTSDMQFYSLNSQCRCWPISNRFTADLLHLPPCLYFRERNRLMRDTLVGYFLRNKAAILVFPCWEYALNWLSGRISGGQISNYGRGSTWNNVDRNNDSGSTIVFLGLLRQLGVRPGQLLYSRGNAKRLSGRKHGKGFWLRSKETKIG